MPATRQTERMALFANAAPTTQPGAPPPTGPFSHCKPSGSPPDTDQLPAVHLTHAEAQAYCQWAGGRLPTAAEWRTAGFTELRSQPPAPWVRGTTYP